MNQPVDNELAAASGTLANLREEVGQVIVGQKDLIDRLLIGLVCNGHILIEGIPGLAKTLTVSTLAKTLNADFKRIQFTPDLLPGDLIGTLVYNQKTGDFTTHQGPIFGNIILADEINRSPAKVQSALLEAMQERQVTIGKETYPLEQPFLVLATQNPIEQEGTYPLPEAQMDRFMFKLLVDYPSMDEEHEVMKRMAKTAPKQEAVAVIEPSEVLALQSVVDRVHMNMQLERYILKLVDATRHPKNHGLEMSGWIRHGASPRASIFLAMAAKGHALLRGRDFAEPDDVKSIAADVLRHRVALTYKAEAAEVAVEEIIENIIDHVEIPTDAG